MEKLNQSTPMRPAGLFLLLILASIGLDTARADRLVLKNGRTIYGSIKDEKDSVIRYSDRFERPRRISSADVDTVHYDTKEVRGLVKVAFRKGQPKDRSGYFRIRHSEELDLDAEYKTDSTAELDLFFRDNVHVRILPKSRFRVMMAPKSGKDPLVIKLDSGRLLATSPPGNALVRIVSPWGIAVGRGSFQAGVVSTAQDSSLQVVCLRGLTGVQESAESPGELVVEEGRSVTLFKKDGVFNRAQPSAEVEKRFADLAANMGRYRFSRIEYPQIGYLPKAITGLGFMVFFYGTAIGILDYVNHI